MTNEEDFTAGYKRHIVTLGKAATANKAAVFDALAAASITSVTVEFDGEGDSGGIEHVWASSGDAHPELPALSVPFHRVKFGTDAPVVEPQMLHGAIEELCYGYLAQEHGGWENNDGAYGTFEFNVTARTIELTFNGRFTDVSTSVHEF